MAELRLVIQLALGTVFMLSSGGKLQDRRRFAQGLAAYRILPASSANLASFLIIALEAFLAVAHLTAYLLKLALLVGLGLLGSFAVAVSVNLKRGRALPCYCFGQSGQTISGTTLARLVLLASGEVFLLKAHQPVYPQHIALPELGLALFWAIFILTTGVWFFGLRDIGHLLRPMR